MAAPYFELLTGAELLERRDFAINDTTILDPLSTNPLVEGEWLELNSSKKLIRGSGETSVPYVGPFWGERGRYDIRAINKLPILLWGNYEAYTKVIANGNDSHIPSSLGDKLVVTDVTVDSLTRRGLSVASGMGHHLVVAFYYGAGRTTGEQRILVRSPFDLYLAS